MTISKHVATESANLYEAVCKQCNKRFVFLAQQKIGIRIVGKRCYLCGHKNKVWIGGRTWNSLAQAQPLNIATYHENNLGANAIPDEVPFKTIKLSDYSCCYGECEDWITA